MVSFMVWGFGSEGCKDFVRGYNGNPPKNPPPGFQEIRRTI